MMLLHTTLWPLPLLFILTSAIPHWLQLAPRSISPSYNLYTSRSAAHYTYAGIGPQPTIALTPPTPSSSLSPSSITPSKCNRDNCLRVFLRKPLVGAEVCAAFTAVPVSEMTDLPVLIAGACKDDVVRVSSACSCLFTGIPAPTTTSLGGTEPASTSTFPSLTGTASGTGYSATTTLTQNTWTNTMPPYPTGTGHPAEIPCQTGTTASPYPTINSTYSAPSYGTGTSSISGFPASTIDSLPAPYPTQAITVSLPDYTYTGVPTEIGYPASSILNEATSTILEETAPTYAAHIPASVPAVTEYPYVSAEPAGALSTTKASAAY